MKYSISISEVVRQENSAYPSGKDENDFTLAKVKGAKPVTQC